jgi:hypothetical protein
MTDGQLSLGDVMRRIHVRTRMDQAAVVAQITFVPVIGSFFYRASFSAVELDDTSRNRKRIDFPRSVAFTISASQKLIQQPAGLSAALENAAPKRTADKVSDRAY